MPQDIETLKTQLCASDDCPAWLRELLTTVPSCPADVVPHKKPKHPDTTNLIADAYLHPAMEACLHLINTDLYSAHFLVRKAQGGARYIDWLHAILHKLEGDYRNAKMWYTDLANAKSCSAFTDFWTTPNAHQHTDLIAFAATKGFQAQKYYDATTASADKIKDSGAALSVEELKQLGPEDAARAAEVMQLELVWLLHRMHSEYGWKALDAAQTTEALKEQAQSGNDPEAKEKAHNMVFSSGQRRF